MSYAPTNPKVQLFELDPTTYMIYNYDSISETTITPHINLSDPKIFQQIWSQIFNDKQDPKYLKRYYGNENPCRKSKENWAAAISAAQCDFMIKSDYVPPDKSDPYYYSTSELADGYIFRILHLNIPTSDSHQCRNSLKLFCKRDPNGEGFITDGCGAWFTITALYETTTNTDYYR